MVNPGDVENAPLASSDVEIVNPAGEIEPNLKQDVKEDLLV